MIRFEHPITKKLITITGVAPVEVLGANDANLRQIRTHFPKLSIIARGDTLKVSGTVEELSRFEERFAQLVEHAVRYNERTVAERSNARLKDEFGGNQVRVQGAAKVMSHLMFGVLVLSADQLMRLLL